MNKNEKWLEWAIELQSLAQDGRILLVKENNGTWSLPGGWVDVQVSVMENVVIAVQDREKHNLPVYA